jgi:hypothetical protein
VWQQQHNRRAGVGGEGQFRSFFPRDKECIVLLVAVEGDSEDGFVLGYRSVVLGEWNVVDISLCA